MSSISCAASAVVPFDPTEARRQRGLAIAALCKIRRKQDAWIVPSQTGQGYYSVRLDSPDPSVPLCDCPDYEARGEPCKHVHAVRFVIEREADEDGDGTVRVIVPVTQATAPRKTYKQDWPAYNKAQTTEKHRFQVLLADLCKGITEPPPRQGKGQRPHSLADMVFATTFKVFSTVSGRRFACDLADAHAKGYIAKVPHFNSVLNYLRTPELTPIFRALITESSLPLKAVEVDFAVDSTGFSTNRFVRWFDHKYGKPRREYDWVKCHLMCGVKTNVVTAVEIRERDSADAPQFIPLVKATARNFGLRDVVADKAYIGYDNTDAVFELGGTPYIPFRSNASGARGGLYEKMFHFYSLHRGEFMGHYHKRSNVESTNSMIKGKFGDHVRSKTNVGMVNEALAKILCHNLCCLIQSHYELGIVPEFWGKEEAPSPDDIVGEPLALDEIEAWGWV